MRKVLYKMGNKIDLEDIEFARNGFDYMDYNNQRNFLWCMVDMATAKEQGQRYDKTKFPYGADMTCALADILPKAGSDRLRAIAMKLTDIGARTKLMELMAA